MTAKKKISATRAIHGEAFAGRSVFVTGHTGFKGSWLTIWLHALGAKVSGYSSGSVSSPANFEVSHVRELMEQHHEADIRSVETLQKSLDAAEPDVIFHLAAQPLVRESYQTPYETFEANFMGTCNLLEAIRLRNKPCTVIVVTSDKCYENVESSRPYEEGDAMGGHDPYSASKGAVELLVASYRRSFFDPERVHKHGVKLASVRAGNVIGGGDWARDRIVPDIVSRLAADQAVVVRNPSAVRPWQHVLEPLNGYLTLASSLLAADDAELCEGWNFGPTELGSASVRELVEKFCATWGNGTWERSGDANQPHEAMLLRLSIDKATSQLGWHPVWTIDQTIDYTARWYREYFDAAGRCMLDCCLRDIADFSRDARDERCEAKSGSERAAVAI